MNGIPRSAMLLALAFALVAVFAPSPASACPPCENHEMWTGTPCKAGNCSPCGFCAYCCVRFGIGCQYCDAALTDAVTAFVPGACDDPSTPLFVDQFERLFGSGAGDASPRVLAPAQ